MLSLRSALLLLAALPVAFTAQTLTFVPPSKSPTEPSANYVGRSNFTLPRSKLREGIAFDRFITIYMENTDFEVAAATAVFQKLASMGITLGNFRGLAHPSEPNYVGAGGGDTWGLLSDDFVYAPANVSTIVDLLEEKGVPWVNYQENMPCDGYNGKTFSSFNYLTGNGTDAFYQRKHNPLAIYNSTNQNPRRAGLQRNFNDFAADIQQDALPSFIFMTPNIVNDAHDTGIDPFGTSYLEYFLFPLLNDKRFNGDNTLILLTFDENENGPENNRVMTLALGNAIPKRLRGTIDNTYLTHYTVLTTAQLNWGLNCLGRQDTNRTVANVIPFVAEAAGFKNLDVKQIPLTNGSTPSPGPLSPLPGGLTPWRAPNTQAKCVNPHGHVYVNNNPPINPDLFDNGQCPQVAFSHDASLEWSTALDAKIIAEQRRASASTLLIDPEQLKSL